MTVQKLFRQIGFNAVMDALRHTHRNDKSIKSTALYKQAFDHLSALPFSKVDGKVTFDVTPKEHWFDEGCLPLLANGVEGDLWENIVGKEVVKPVDNPFTDAELAGAILWGATFYGFTNHHRWNPFNEIFTEYGKWAKALERKLYVPYIQDKKTLQNLKSDDLCFGIAFTREVWDEIHKHQQHQNRQKRKRFYRLKQRIKHLKNLDRRTKNILEIQRKTGINLGELKDRIINASAIFPEWRECNLSEGMNRVEYAIDLMANYFPSASDILSVGDEAVIVFYTQPDNMLSANETSILREYLSSQSGMSQINFYEGVDKDLTSTLGIEILRIRIA